MIMSTIGESLTFRPRTRNAISMDSRLSSAMRRCSNSSRPKAFTTRMEDKTSWMTDTISPSFRRTSRVAFLMRRV